LKCVMTRTGLILRVISIVLRMVIITFFKHIYMNNISLVITSIYWLVLKNKRTIISSHDFKTAVHMFIIAYVLSKI